MTSVAEQPLRLTRFSHGAGCGCKLSPADLRTVLGLVRDVGGADDPNLLVGFATADWTTMMSGLRPAGPPLAASPASSALSRIYTSGT